MHASARTLVLVAVAALLGSTVFSVTYSLRAPDPVTQAGPPAGGPDDSVTPAPNATPDTNSPFWHIPYINQNRQRTPFSGRLNGLTVDPTWTGRSAFDVCPGVGLTSPKAAELLKTVTSPGPLQIDPQALPEGITPTSSPDAFLCRGLLAQVAWRFLVAPGGPSVNPGGSDLSITRTRGLEPVVHSAPAERWKSITIAGSQAILASPIVVADDKQYGSCFLAVYQTGTDVLTTFLADAANDAFCVAVAEATVR